MLPPTETLSPPHSRNTTPRQKKNEVSRACRQGPKTHGGTRFYMTGICPPSTAWTGLYQETITSGSCHARNDQDGKANQNITVDDPDAAMAVAQAKTMTRDEPDRCSPRTLKVFPKSSEGSHRAGRLSSYQMSRQKDHIFAMYVLCCAYGYPHKHKRFICGNRARERPVPTMCALKT